MVCVTVANQDSSKNKNKKKQEASGLLSNLGIKTPSSKIPLVGPFFVSDILNMNEIVNKLLLAGDNFKLEMHLRQPGFTYSACGLFT